jgi:hypothetical protein
LQIIYYIYMYKNLIVKYFFKHIDGPILPMGLTQQHPQLLLWARNDVGQLGGGVSKDAACQPGPAKCVPSALFVPNTFFRPAPLNMPGAFFLVSAIFGPSAFFD